MSQDTVQQLEENIRQAREFIELEKSLQRLQENRDFKKVVMEGYLKNEAVRLVHLKADPSMQKPEQQASIDRDITAVGSFLQYLRTVNHLAQIALKEIEQAEVVRDEILAEELAQ